jgi:predicted lactoylglutathione lyase
MEIAGMAHVQLTVNDLARSREDIDEFHQFLVREGVRIVHAPEDGPWAPGYYSVLFEDPDGIRLEVNYVPGKGLFESAEKLPLAEFAGHQHSPE